ncbi:MAG: ADP-ribosylglycohydrolase family protein [Planctomycetes bacterium]|nr:ADP-ribosylglycohydrolase family protein [Planctomycetota bacterium]
MGSLEDRVFGCLAAGQIGSAMGAPVEGWPWRRIQEEYGYLNRLLPYEHYENGWVRAAGTTEDGIERQRVLLRAIRRAGGRITARDVAAVWREEVDPEHARWLMEPFDRYLIGLARAGVPAGRIGSFSPYTNLVSLARSCQPIGLVNALAPGQAWEDVHRVGLALQPPAGSGMDWAGLVTAIIAEACRPEATYEGALEAGLSLVDEEMEAEVRRALALADEAEAPLELREAFGAYYGGHGIPYAASYANEIVCKALAILKRTAESPKEAILTAVNFGRDTDCLAAVAGSIAGALAGAADLPAEWIAQVDAATRDNPHTCLHLSLAEMTQIVMSGLHAEQKRAATRASELANALGSE